MAIIPHFVSARKIVAISGWHSSLSINRKNSPLETALKLFDLLLLLWSNDPHHVLCCRLHFVPNPIKHFINFIDLTSDLSGRNSQLFSIDDCYVSINLAFYNQLAIFTVTSPLTVSPLGTVTVSFSTTRFGCFDTLKL